jgi:hypothetical protein
MLISTLIYIHKTSMLMSSETLVNILKTCSMLISTLIHIPKMYDYIGTIE